MHFRMTLRLAGLAFLALLMPIGAAAQDEQPTSTAIVPVVGTVTGIGGVHWRTDVELRNPFGSDLDVALTLPTIGDAPFLFFTMTSGQTIVLNDIMHEAFGLDETLAPLVVTTAGRRSVTVSCVVHGTGPKGEVRPQIELTNYSDMMPLHSSFPRVSHDGKFRTNVGLVNYGDSAVRITLAVQRLTGRNLATTTVTIPPLTLRHVPLLQLFPLLTKATDLILVSESSDPRAYTYVSVLRNDTHDGVFDGP